MHNQGLGSRVVRWSIALPLLLTAVVWGGNGGLIILPSGGVKNRSGLRMEIDSKWVNGTGYRPVRIRLEPQPPGPAPADRTLQVRLRASGWYQGSHAGAVTATVELKQGDLFRETTVLVPQTNTWAMMEVETREAGRVHWELGTNTGLGGGYYNLNPEQTPSIVVVHWGAGTRSSRSRRPDRVPSLYFELAPLVGGIDGSVIMPWVQANPDPHWWSGLDPRRSPFPGLVVLANPGTGPDYYGIALETLPDLRKLVSTFPEYLQNTYGNVASLATATGATNNALTQNMVDNLPGLFLLAPESLPSEWLAYTNFDVLIIAREVLAEVTNEQRQALRTWLHMGAVLCVYDAGEDFSQLSQLEQLLELEPVDPDAVHRGWSSPAKTDFHVTVDALARNGQNAVQYQYVNGTMVPLAAPSPPVPPVAPEKPTFVTRRAGRGKLAAIAAADPFPGQPAEWSWMFNSIPSNHWLKYQRVGVSQYQDNHHFWDFLIEGIGRAPVKSFLGMITLFVVLIGPANYWLLFRRRKLYLLLVTVPAGAALVSVSLFLFAIVADGLGTRLRLRSYTELDADRGEYRTWSRQTYYAGLTPSGGLTFPAESEVIRVEHRPTKFAGSEDRSRHMVWGEDQHLVAGYFQPRTMSQFVVIERADTEARVLVRESAEKPPTVRNELGVDIERAALRDSRGDLFEVVNLRSGEEQLATKLDLESRGEVWKSAFRAETPRFPPNFDPAELDDVTGFLWSSYRPFANTGVPPAMTTGVMEVALASLHDGQFTGLEQKSFVAVVPRSPFVARGVASISEEKGTHTVVGRWRAW